MYNFFRAFITTVFNYTDEGICFTDVNRNILYWNSGAAAITGYRFAEIAGRNCDQVISYINQKGEFDGTNDLTVQAAENAERQERRLSITHKDGHPIPVLLRSFPVYDDDAALAGFIHLITDNSSQKVEQSKLGALTKAAYIDSLTELFSKQYLENRLRTLLSTAPNRREAFSILYVHITGFREFNEKYGVSRADQLLKMVAKTLSSVICASNIIGRWHGASFIVIAKTANKSLILLLADKLKELAAETKFAIGEEMVSIRLAIGHTVSQDYDTVDYLIERAIKASLERRAPEAPPAPEKPQADKATVVSGQRKESGFHSASSRR
ncbi:sensor domain-containing diguanylate cyclase [Sporomusa sphaeroides]|uniref:sensor domain-containing diguanylate cyclase n=1 Tax=Sporomusa sphaeroides TaxID=47679 RepID=UPI00202F0196|nr:sensor domain-containing diguanylate cyclase [Sporomusa sphaeroides]MCM0759211.1 sensor domain-containing diguanylate cyclase [Sporomusa sphaeroides DSM 2875]HML35293.1 sensor domain-containing diguanylate cyclase [Sporomusa sphaeroides]